ncbi:MAG TPA: MarR family transcriptional regulator [Hyphomicrobiales bacterium]|nr:MarR family transcriptional regulator [Hyphomicrobiales bacterium]
MADDDLSMGYLVHWAGRLLRRLADRKLKAIGLTSGHLPVVNALAQAEPMSQKALAEWASIEQPTMAATLARMERDGIVERRPDARDRRVALFSLTAATRGKIGALRMAVEEVNQEALSALPADQRATFRHQLETMARAMEKRLGEEL